MAKHFCFYNVPINSVYQACMGSTACMQLAAQSSITTTNQRENAVNNIGENYLMPILGGMHRQCRGQCCDVCHAGYKINRSPERNQAKVSHRLFSAAYTRSAEVSAVMSAMPATNINKSPRWETGISLSMRCEELKASATKV
eukprot:1156318-Pelagomonas_calceolata.AAC.9